MSIEIPYFLARKKRCFGDGSYHYSSSIGLHFKNEENISFCSSSVLSSRELFFVSLAQQVASNVFSYAWVAHIFHSATHSQRLPCLFSKLVIFVSIFIFLPFFVCSDSSLENCFFYKQSYETHGLTYPTRNEPVTQAGQQEYCTPPQTQ